MATAVRRFETPPGKQAQVDWGHLGYLETGGEQRQVWGFATTLGYKTWANLATADMMIRSAENMKSFLADVDKASRAPSDKEYAELVARADARLAYRYEFLPESAS